MIKVIRYYLYYRKHSIHHPDKVLKLLQGAHQEGFVLRRYYVLAQYSIGQSLEEIAKSHNVTRERVRQIINKFVHLQENPQDRIISSAKVYSEKYKNSL